MSLPNQQLQQFEQAYQTFFEGVSRFMAARIADPQTAEDLTSQTFLRVFRHWPPRSLVKAAVGAWTFQIARNILTDYYRAQGRQATVALNDADEMQGHQAAHEDEQLQKIILQTAWAELSAKDRHLLTLRTQGYTNKEMAERLNLSEDAAAQAVYRALKRLQKKVNHDN